MDKPMFGAYAGDGENCFLKNTDMEFRCIQNVGFPGESVCLDKDWAGFLSSKCNKNLMTFEGMASYVRRLRFLEPF